MAKVTDIQDMNGATREIQDKDLANRTSQSSVASSDYVLLEDTNGAYHKISKASFTEAVRGALGSVINSVAKGTDIAKLPVLDSNNDLGMGTLANVASVLGALTASYAGTALGEGMPIGSGQHLAFKPWGGNYNYTLHLFKAAEGAGGALYHGVSNSVSVIPTVWRQVITSIEQDSGVEILKQYNGDGLYLCGAYSTDGTEYSCYIGMYKNGSIAPSGNWKRLDGGTACGLASNTYGTLDVASPTSGKTYKYYSLKIGSI